MHVILELPKAFSVRTNSVAELRNTTTSKTSDSATFACPLIVSPPKGEYTAIQFVEDRMVVKKVGVGKRA